MGIKVGVMVCNLNWATGDFWSVARLGVPGDIYSWWAGEVSGLLFFGFFLLLNDRIIAARQPLGLPSGLFSLHV